MQNQTVLCQSQAPVLGAGVVTTLRIGRIPFTAGPRFCAGGRFSISFNLGQFLLPLELMSGFLDTIRKKADLRALLTKLRTNKRLSLVLILGFALLLYVLFNSQGVLPRLRLEREKKAMIEKIRRAEDEQKQLQEQSKALEGDKKAIEKVAREKYGMVREGEKVYKVVPKK